jgi:predicted nucleic acid-binding protein
VNEPPRPAAVCDAGPLIHLGEIGRAALLAQFRPLVVPQSVRTEAASFRPPPEFVWQVAPVSETDRAAATQRLIMRLHLGETDCLALCAQYPSAILLTDDLAARREAQRLGFAVHGSVGVVVRAFRIGLFSREEADAALVALRDCRSLFVSRAIIALAREQLTRDPSLPS